MVKRYVYSPVKGGMRDEDGIMPLWSVQQDMVLASDYDALWQKGLEATEAMGADANRIAALEDDLARTQAVCRDITARAEKLAAEVRQWRMCVFQDENKPFDKVGT